MGLFSTLRRSQSRVSASSFFSYEHVEPERDSPSLPNKAPTPHPTPKPSTMFRRKKQSAPLASATENGHLAAPPPRSAASVSSVGDDEPLNPPPRRSTVFAGSTQSLPDAGHGVRPGLHESPSTPDVKQKKGLFSWARGNKQSTTPKPPPMPSSASPSSRNPKLSSPDDERGEGDFSLRAFRHVTSTSPCTSPVEPSPKPPSALSSYTDLPPPRPRPRGTSTASDASQRVSVAAFREMQARRSAAGSPTPSASPLMPPRVPPIGRSELRPPVPSAYSTTSMYSASGSASSSSPNIGRQQKPQPQTRGSMFARTDDTSSESEEEEEEESGEDEPTLRPTRQNTIRGKGRQGQGELGVRMQPPRAPALQNSGRSASAGSVSASPARGGRNPSGGLGISIAASRSRTTLASDSGSDSDDDAPLAQFIPPRSRAGSAASGRFPMPPKPLVDLGGLKPPSSTSLVNIADGPSSTGNNPNTNGRKPPVPRRTMDMSELESSSSGHGLGRMPQPTCAATLGVGIDSAFSPPPPSIDNLAASLSPAGSASPQAPASSASPSMGVNLSSSTTTPSIPPTSPNMSAEPPARGRTRSSSLGLGLAERLSQLTAGLARSPSPGPNRAVSPGPVRGISPGPGRVVSPGPSAGLVSHTLSTGLASPPPVPALDSVPSGDEPGQTTSRHTRHAADHEANHNSNSNPMLNLPPPRESSLAPIPNSVTAKLGLNSAASAYSATSSFKNHTRSTGDHESDSDEESEDEREKELSASPEPPIIPVPVKERPRGPPSFAVTSRPGHGRSSSVGIAGSGSGSIEWSEQGHGRSESQATVTGALGSTSPTSSTVRMAGAARREEEQLPVPRPSPARKTPTRSLTAEQQRLPLAGPISPSSSSSIQLNKIAPSSSSLQSKTKTARTAPPTSFTNSSNSSTSHSHSSAKSTQATVSSTRFPGSSAISSAASSATASTSSGSTGPSPYGGILKNSASRSLQQTSQPPRPWARDDSPSSSTGGSSSSRAPATPRDGSELGTAMPGSSLLGGGRAKHKRQSVSFGDAEQVRSLGVEREKSGDSSGKSEVDEERRRRERRRSEARAAIELGNVMNGKAPVTDDDDGVPLNAAPLFPHATGPAGMGMYPGMQMPGMQMSGMQMSGMQMSGMQMPGMQGMQMPGMMPNMTGSPGMMPPMPQMMPGMNGMQGMMGMQDPNMLAAHQHAMLIAKQTYQWAVAQQAMAAAGDEWERSGGSVAGWNPSSASAYGGAESVVGFPSSASVAGFPASGRAPSMFMNQGMGGMGMGGGMGMSPMMMSSGGSVVGGMGGMGNSWGYMGSAQSMYAGSTYAPSEVGGPSQRQNFSSSRSEYGGGERSSRAFGNSRPPPVPAMPAGMQGQQGQRGGPRQRTLTAPGPGKKSGARTLLGHVAPPSSWKGPA